MKKVYVCAALLGLIPAAGWAGGDQTQDEPMPTMEEVVVTATKSEEKRKDIPNAVIVKDSLDIDESPAQSVGELLANEPGVDLRTRGNYGGATEEIHLRGMGADATQVMINGVVINSPSFGSADVSQVPLNSIERVEVVKGPGSVLYGSGAMGGTVYVITKRPERDFITAAADAGIGTESSYRLAAEHGMFIGDDFGYYLTASRVETDGFRDNSDLEHTDVSMNLVYEKDDRFDISLYGDYVDREYGLPGPRPPAGTMDYFIGSAKIYNSDSSSLVNRGADENYRSAVEARARATDWLDLRLKADYSRMESFNHTIYAWGAGDETTVVNTIKGMEANMHLSPFSWLKGIVGTEYRDFNYENEQDVLDGTGAVLAGFTSRGEHKVNTGGTFAEISVSPVEKLKLIAGFRYEDHSRFGSESVPRFGLVFNPLDNTTFKVNHGKHFKAPTMNDLFWPDDGFAKGNPNLEPETGWHTDMTVEQGLLENRAFVTASYFHWDLNDKIDWAEDPDQPTIIPGWNYWTPSNISTYRADGIELGAGIGPFYGFRGDLSFTYQDVEEELIPGITRQARYKPETLFKCSVTHSADFGLTSNITARYYGERPGYYRLLTDTEPREVLDAYWTVDMKFTQEFTDNLRVSLSVSNLFDEEYATYLANFTDQNTFMTTQQPYPGAGRSVFATVTYEF